MTNKRKTITAFLTGAPVGLFGGLIGLGGAEFRLPLLVGIFKYPARKAVALNLVISLITVLASLVFRVSNINIEAITPFTGIMVAMVAASMIGAFMGADFSKKVTESLLNRAILILLVLIGGLLIVESVVPFIGSGIAFANIFVEVITAIFFGLIIGFISSLLGVAGGELIIPTLILVFGVDAKLAGTISMMISLPTMLIGIYRHAHNKVYNDKSDFPTLVLPMGIGSIIGAFLGASLVVYVSSNSIKLILGCLLIFSAIKLFLEKKQGK